MGNLRNEVLNNEDVRLAEANYKNADRANQSAIERHNKTKAAREKARKAQKAERARAENAYNEAVREALEKAKEHFGDRKFTAADLESFLGEDVSWQEFSSWAWHHCCGDYNYTKLGTINYHLPKGIKTTGPREIVNRFVQLDEDGKIIPGTEFKRIHDECALYWFE